MDMLTSPVVCRWSGCNLYFADSEELLIHCTNDHIGRKSTNNLCLDCHWEGCDVKTTKRDHITSHMKVHIAHKPHACLRCGKTFKRPQDLKKHEKLHMDGQEAQLQDNIIFQPYTIPSSEYSSSNGFDFKVSQRDLSPQSASSEILATTPPGRKPSQNPQMNQYFNQLYNGIIEKQLVPQYNNEMSSFLNTLATSEDYSQSLQTVVNKDMDIDYFNSFMGQLQNDITGNLGCFQNNPNSFVPFQQNMPNMVPCNQGFDPAFPTNGNSYMPHNNQAYFNNDMNPCQQNYQQQPMNMYQDLNYSDNMSSQPNMPYDMNMANQYVSMEAPQVNYMYPQYTSMTVTPQRCEASEFLDEDKDDTSVNKAVKDDSVSKETATKAVNISAEDDLVSSEIESLAQTLKNLELYSKEDQGKVITPKEADERLQHAALINDLVAKVNSIYQALNTLPKPLPKKEPFLSDLIEKKVQTPVTLTSGSYPSLDDL